MKTPRNFGRPAYLIALLCCALFGGPAAQGQETPRIVLKKPPVPVDILPPGAQDWIRTGEEQTLRPGYRVRTGPNSRATIRWSDNSVVPLGVMTEVEILPPHAADTESGLQLFRGILSFLHREKPGRIRVITRGAVAGIRGTEFILFVDPQTERTVISVVDGEVGITNALGFAVLSNREQAVVDIGQAPQKTPGFIVNNVLQWAFYYPAVLDLQELPLTSDEKNALAASLDAYRAGDLISALTNYPAARQPSSESDRIYHAALLLSVGRAEESQIELNALPADRTPRTAQLAGALQQLIAAVKGDMMASAGAERLLASELLAGSYYEQSRAQGDESLNRALALARKATTASPELGFAWTRVAELEFSFGRTAASLEALEKGLALSPRNAQALALKGFLLAAQNKPREALDWFNRAMDVDSSLGNAWLGRGLVKIRRGDLSGGLDDLLIAAAIEPHRAVLRSYLGKAYAESNDPKRALHELDLAKTIDANDPTAWLYSALVKAEHNRINEAIRDLERSQELNDNRSVYRSSLLVDQDRGVGSANLARIYADAGMNDWSLFAATRAVSYDYANYSAHYFLANSYNQLRDRNLINLRYETPSQTEYLLANLLAPVGAGILSPAVSQQEYSKLFERDRLGVVSDTEYLSRRAWTQSGAQFGTFGNFSYSLEAFYRSDEGYRHNDDVEQRHLSLQVKQQLTPQDTLLLQVINYDAEGGDLAQYYNQYRANTGFRFEETQEPIVALGYHREWSPGNHTVFLAARLEDTLSVINPSQGTYLKFTPSNSLVGVHGLTTHQDFESEAELYSTELQQIWQVENHSTILGGRFQWGEFDTRNKQTSPSRAERLLPDPPADQMLSVNFHRNNLYAYHYWELLKTFQLIGGVSYDRITFPENFRDAPLSSEEETVEKVSPKAGFIWTPTDDTTARFAYTRSLTGASLDQSYRLEPAQVGGFVQSYRSIIPESVSGPVSGAEVETFGLSLEKRLPSGTYLAISGESLDSEGRRTVGAFQYDFFSNQRKISTLREHLDYCEKSLVVSVSQLVGDDWTFGARYRVTDAQLDNVFPEAQRLQERSEFEPRQRTESLLHEVRLFAVFNHHSGVFSQLDAAWYNQKNELGNVSTGGDDFWQLNILAGYRFPRRHAIVTAGILNVTDQNYRLNPLTTYNDLPHDRTAVVRLTLSF